MNILFLTNFYPPHHLGGYEELCAEAAAGLINRGHEVRILTSNHLSGINPEDSGAIYRSLYPVVSLKPYQATIDYFFRREQHLADNLHRLAEVVTDFRPLVVVIWGMWNLHNQLAEWLEKESNIPVVYYIADLWPLLPDAYTLHWREPARKWYTKLIKGAVSKLATNKMLSNQPIPLLSFTNVICVSKAVQEKLVEGGLPVANAKVIHNGIDLNVFMPTLHNDISKNMNGRLSLVYAGRISPEKGLHTAIDAMAVVVQHHPKATLTLIGSGPDTYLKQLKERATQKRVSEQVVFQGRIPRHQLPEELAKHPVFVAPSTGPEALSRNVQEAMACGLVVVATNVGGMKELLSDGVNSLCFPVGDSDALAACVNRLSQDPNLCDTLSTNGINTVSKGFNIDRMMDDLENYLCEITGIHQEQSGLLDMLPVKK